VKRMLLAVLLIATGGVVHAQGFALQFDGLDDKVTISDDFGDLDLGSWLTLEAWVRPNATDYWSEPIIEGFYYNGSRHPPWGLVLNRGGDWYCPIIVSVTSIFYPVGSITPGEWHHLACTYDGSTIRYYQDGQPVGSQVLPQGGPTLDVVGATLGSSWPDEHLEGTIDQVSIWSIVRSASEINLDSLGCIGETSPGLMGLWKMDDGDLQVVTDSSGNGNHGWLGSHGGVQDSDPSWVLSDAPYVCIVFTDGFESRPKRRVPSDRSATPMPLDQAMAATSLECVELDERTLAVPLKGERVEEIVIQARQVDEGLTIFAVPLPEPDPSEREAALDNLLRTSFIANYAKGSSS